MRSNMHRTGGCCLREAGGAVLLVQPYVGLHPILQLSCYSRISVARYRLSLSVAGARDGNNVVQNRPLGTAADVRTSFVAGPRGGVERRIARGVYGEKPLATGTRAIVRAGPGRAQSGPVLFFARGAV
jgi:hypothetical protein